MRANDFSNLMLFFDRQQGFFAVLFDCCVQDKTKQPCGEFKVSGSLNTMGLALQQIFDGNYCLFFYMFVSFVGYGSLHTLASLLFGSENFIRFLNKKF